MTTEKYAGNGSSTSSALPQPPNGYNPAHDEDGRPPCARCVREGGITRFGTRYPPNRSDIHPHHTHAERGARGNVTGLVHRGPREPLCSHHVELVAWETHGKRLDYPAPPWTRGRP